VCRSDRTLAEGERQKIALFTNVESNAVFSAPDVDTIYQIPRLFHDQGLDVYVVGRLKLNVKAPDLNEWDRLLNHYIIQSMRSKLRWSGNTWI